jgi:hypothetical protein
MRSESICRPEERRSFIPDLADPPIDGGDLRKEAGSA